MPAFRMGHSSGTRLVSQSSALHCETEPACFRVRAFLRFTAREIFGKPAMTSVAAPVGAAEPEPPVIRSLEYDEHEVLSGGSQMRGSSADQPRSSDDSMCTQPYDGRPPRRGPSPGAAGERSAAMRSASSSGGGGDRPPSYQTEERYWTDYLRIALPIAGLLLLLRSSGSGPARSSATTTMEPRLRSWRSTSPRRMPRH